MRIRFDELLYVLTVDPFYGAGEPQTVTKTEKDAQGRDVEVTITRESPPRDQYPITKILVAKVYSENAGHQLYAEFRQRWNGLPCKRGVVRHLTYLWCGMMGLPTYQKSGDPTGWAREDFLDNWEEDHFFIELNGLASFLDKHQLPLPISLYPNASYNSLIAIDDINRAFDRFRPTLHESLLDEEHYPIGSWNAVESGRPCSGNERGYLPLFSAIKLVTTGDENTNRLNAEGLGLLSRARREYSKWGVRECWTRPIWETIHYVHLGDFIRWAWDHGCYAPDDVIKRWLRESEPDKDTGVRLHILFRIAEYESAVIEAIPESLHPLTARQWKRVENLAHTRAHLIRKETKDYGEFKSKEKELRELDADIGATTGILVAAQESGTIAVGGNEQGMGSAETTKQPARNAANERQNQSDSSCEKRPHLDRKGQIFSSSSDSPSPFIAYPKALKLLADRLEATQDEMAAWVWMGPEQGGLAAYLNANELDPPPRFYYDNGNGHDFDYLAPPMACWFCSDDIANFQPSDRYITGEALIERWDKEPGIQPEAFIRAKIAESRLLDAHPIGCNPSPAPSMRQ